MTEPVKHETLVFERDMSAPAELVYRAFIDPDARSVWSSPSENVTVRYEQSDARVGGRDVSVCPAPEQPDIRIEQVYCDLVDGRRVVFAETVETNGRRMAASLVTAQMQDAEGGSKLIVTAQIAAFDGGGIIKGARFGWGGALDRLRDYVVRAV